MIKLLVADDHPVVREGIKKIFENEPSFQITEEARTGQEVLNKIRKTEVDIVLLDITMPGKSWLEVLKELRRDYPDVGVLIVSMHSEDEYVLRALRAGASGYLVKESVMTELVEAVRKISHGGKYISQSLAETVLFQLDKDPDKLPHTTLSDREYEVLCLIAQGKNSREIAQSLFISENTVGTYRARILDKMGLRNTAELIRYAVKHRLVD
jgi:two-component system invasion response regulator UvrY